MEIPNYSQIPSDMNPLPSALFEIFPDAARQMIPYFKEREESLDINRSLASEMLRFEVKIRLQRYGIFVDYEEAQDEPLPEMVLNPLARNGLEGVFKGYPFKILKADVGGSLPVPGASHRKRAFYAQQLRLIPVGQDFDSAERPNVIFLWGFDSSYVNIDLRLAVPREGGTTRASVDHYFNEQIPHPATNVVRPDSKVAPQTEPKIRPKVSVATEAEPVRSQPKV